MNILVVRSADGDLYFRGNSSREQINAAEAAVNFVLNHTPEDFDQGALAQIRHAFDTSQWRKLYDLLVECGAIRICQFQ